MDEDSRRIIAFLKHVGLVVEVRDLRHDTFLPGITVRAGSMVVDPKRLRHPGDLLHEAGHLAVLPVAERRAAAGCFANHGGHEIAAIAWSYAACVHLGLPLRLLFHDDGFKDDATWFAETFSGGTYIGLPLLAWKGMTSAIDDPVYPKMRHWLCP